VIALLAGVALAVPYVLYARRRGKRAFAIGLVLAAIVYVPFAIAAGTRHDVFIEVCGVALFGVLAILGTRSSAYFLAAGWAAHGAWDVVLHPIGSPTYAPWWYPVACIGFDIVVAAALLLRQRGRHIRTPRPIL
jgi:hypothetical protein